MRRTGLLLTLMCLAALAVSAQEEAEGAAATTIRALEHQWLEAQARNDSRSLDLIFDNDLVYMEYGELVTKGAYLARVRLEKSNPSQIVMEPMTVRVFDKTVIVIGSFRERSIKNGKPLVRQWRFIDTWTYQNGGWVLVAAGATPTSK
jgi:ketosteroid isomerase-like protein